MVLPYGLRKHSTSHVLYVACRSTAGRGGSVHSATTIRFMGVTARDMAVKSTLAYMLAAWSV